MKSFFSLRGRAVVLMWLFCMTFVAPVSFASVASPWTKVGRGLGNVLFGWADIFYQMGEMGKTERWPIAAGGGLVKGIAYAVARTGVGLYEVVTFPFPIPEGYRVIMEPDFVIPKA